MGAAQLLLAEAPLQPAEEIIQVLNAAISRVCGWPYPDSCEVERRLLLASILVARTGADLEAFGGLGATAA